MPISANLVKKLTLYFQNKIINDWQVNTTFICFKINNSPQIKVIYLILEITKFLICLNKLRKIQKIN